MVHIAYIHRRDRHPTINKSAHRLRRLGDNEDVLPWACLAYDIYGLLHREESDADACSIGRHLHDGFLDRVFRHVVIHDYDEIRTAGSNPRIAHLAMDKPVVDAGQHDIWHGSSIPLGDRQGRGYVFPAPYTIEINGIFCLSYFRVRSLFCLNRYITL